MLAEYVFSEKSEKESFIDFFQRMSYESLETIHDIGPETARSVIVYIEENTVLIQRLLHELSIFIPEKKERVV